METIDDLVATFGQGDAIFRQLKSHHDERNVLGRVRLMTTQFSFLGVYTEESNTLTLVEATPISGPALI